MTVISSLNYRVGLDTSKFIQGATFAQAEWRKMNRLFNETASEAEKTSKKMELLDEAVKKGFISQEQYQETQQRLIERTDAYKQEQARLIEVEKQRLAMEQEALTIRNSLMSAEDRYQQELVQTEQRLRELVRTGNLSTQQAEEYLARFRSTNDPTIAIRRQQMAAIESQRDSMRQQLLFAGTQIPGLGGIGGTLTSLATSAGPIAAIGVGVGAIAGGLYAAERAAVAFYNSMAEARKRIDDANDAAATMGLTLGQLQTIQFGALLGAGVNAEQSAAAIQKLQTVIGQATQAAEGENVFTRLGLDAQELASMNPEEQLLTIADAFQQIPTQAERARVAQDLFGRGNVAMLRYLEQGADGIEEAKRQAEAYGLTLTTFDAERVAAANDEFDIMQLQLQGIANVVAVETSPAFQVMFEEINRMLLGIDKTNNGVRGFTQNLSSWFGIAIGEAQNFAGVYGNIIQAMADVTVGNFASAAENMLQASAAMKEDNVVRIALEMNQAQAEAAQKAKQREDELKASQEESAEIQRRQADAGEQILEQYRKRVEAAKEESRIAQMTDEQYREYLELRRQIAEQEERNKAAEANKQADEEIKRLEQQTQFASGQDTFYSMDAAEQSAELARQAKASSEEEQLRQQGVTEERIKQLRSLREMADQQEREREAAQKQVEDFRQRQQALQDDAERLQESLRLPDQILEEQIARYAEMLDNGLITQQQFEQATKREVARTMADKAEAPSAIAYGSDAAYRAMVDAQQGREQAEAIAQKTREITNTILGEIKTFGSRTAEAVERIQDVQGVA